MQSFKRLQVRARPEMPLRPGWGTLGKSGVVRANFFAVNMPPNATYYDYEIAFAPSEKAKGDRRGRIMQLVEQSPQFRQFVPHIAHDGAQRLVSSQKLPQPISIPIRYLEEDQEDNPNALTFTVEIKFQRELKTSDLTKYVLHCYYSSSRD